MTLSVDESDSVTRQYAAHPYQEVNSPMANKVIPRYIGELEQEVKSLEEELAESRSHELISQESSTPLGPSNPQDRREHSPNFVEGGGIRWIDSKDPEICLADNGNSFMRHLFADSEWREHDPSLLQNLSKGSGPAEAGVKPALLPTSERAQAIFDK
ncbi:uncharacterized protein N7483_006809 [Penicillium malachiteum]|uniref:uncharacterized protein n=1 Tax=Penicillium malachiteum TaxID=1324776 RepID=UPI002546F91F|nr:uncharacterized protein N7483_006809 [Penicillium malachiteum]KAJ5725452.1 hypothetical protein N7483_006809 [Penicillium malachiteum]